MIGRASAGERLMCMDEGRGCAAPPLMNIPLPCFTDRRRAGGGTAVAREWQRRRPSSATAAADNTSSDLSLNENLQDCVSMDLSGFTTAE